MISFRWVKNKESMLKGHMDILFVLNLVFFPLWILWNCWQRMTFHIAPKLLHCKCETVSFRK